MSVRAPALRVSGLTRRYGKVVANDDVNLSVAPGEVVGLLGHNGAGKTTLVSQVVGLLRPHAGSVRIGDLDAVADPAAARRAVGLQPQGQVPIDGLTPRQAVEIAASLRGLSRREARQASLDLAEELDYGPWLGRRALPEGGGLSGGIRRLVAFAMAAVAPVPLLVLDEPTNDVDASRRRLLWKAVRRRADAGCGVMLVTHNVAEAEHVVDRLVVLDQGHVLAQGSPAGLRGDDTALRLELSLAPGACDPTTGPMALSPQRVVRTGRRVLLSIPSAAAQAGTAWAEDLRAKGVVETYSLAPVTLEDTYLALTANSPHATTDEAPAPQDQTRSSS